MQGLAPLVTSHSEGLSIPAILKRLVKNMRIRSKTIALFIMPSEIPKENWSAVSVCSNGRYY